MNVWKRTIASILAVIMICSSIPVTALADDLNLPSGGEQQIVSQEPGADTQEAEESLDMPPSLASAERNDTDITLQWRWDNGGNDSVVFPTLTTLTGEVSWNDNGTESVPEIADAYMTPCAYVSTNNEEPQKMSLWEFYHDFCGYSWAFIQENAAVLGVTQETTTDAEGSAVLLQFREEQLITACTDKQGNSYTVSYGLEYTGKEIPGYTVASTDEQTITATATAQPTDPTNSADETDSADPTNPADPADSTENTDSTEPTDPADQTEQPDTNALIVQIEQAISLLPEAGSITEENKDNVAKQLNVLDTLLQQLDTMLGDDADSTAFDLLSTDAQARYQATLAAMDAVQEPDTLEEKDREPRDITGITDKNELIKILNEDVARVNEIADLIKDAGGADALPDDEKDALEDELNDLVIELRRLRFKFEPNSPEFNAAEEARATAVSLLEQLTDSNEIIAAAGNWDVRPSTNTEDDVFQWKWNDQNNYAHISNLQGTVTWPTKGSAPEITDAYLTMYAYVSTDGGEPEKKTLWEFYHDICGFSWEYLKEKVSLFGYPSLVNVVSDPSGDTRQFHWYAGRLVTSFTGVDGNKYDITYGIEPTEKTPAGFQVEQEGTDKLVATPLTSFAATVEWYDNNNTYGSRYDVDGESTTETARFNAYKEDLVFHRVYTRQQTDENGDPVIDENGDPVTELVTENVTLAADDINITRKLDSDPTKPDTWSISIQDLPMYSPTGEKYTYYLEQNDDKDFLPYYEDKNNPTEAELEAVTDKGYLKPSDSIDTGAYYSSVVTNSDLLESDHPDTWIANNGTVTNTLAREGKVTVYKYWKDGLDNTAESGTRPKTTLYFYRVAESEVTTVNGETREVNELEGSPVPGHDSITDVETIPPESGVTGTLVKITLPKKENEKLPMFDNFGRRYIYYAVERMEDAGDYVCEVDNSGEDVGPTLLDDDVLQQIKDQANRQNYILNGATLTNKRKDDIKIPVTVEFKAQAIQNEMDGTTVDLQLQRFNKETQKWEPYHGKDAEGNDYDGTLTLEFRGEAMTVSGESEPVPEYDDNGNPYEYRWVQTNMTVSGGTPTTPLNTEDITKEQYVTLKDGTNDVGPGVDTDKTTEQFKVEYTPNQNYITNTLYGDTQVVANKTWRYIIDNGDGTTTTRVYPADKAGDGEIGWDGMAITGEDTPEGGWPANTELTYDVYRDGKPYEQKLEMPAGKTTASLIGLPRYDENGNEYSYEVMEQTVKDWDSEWSYDYAVANDLQQGNENIKVTQLTANFGNVIAPPPGPQLIFDVRKEWVDDTDIETRKPVTVALYTTDDEGKEQKVENTEKTLELKNKWYARIVIDNPGDKRVSDYVVKEVSVHGVEAEYQGNFQTLHDNAVAFSKVDDPFGNANRFNQEALDPYIAGSLAANDTDEQGDLDYYYHIYLSATEDNTGFTANYTIYNQRYGQIFMTLRKTWVSGGQDSLATFQLDQSQGYDAEGNANYTEMRKFTLDSASNKAEIGTNGEKTVTWQSKDNQSEYPVRTPNDTTEKASLLSRMVNAVKSFFTGRAADTGGSGTDTGGTDTGGADTNTDGSLYLPKYDVQGVLYSYRLSEVQMSAEQNGKWETVDIVDGVAQFQEKTTEQTTRAVDNTDTGENADTGSGENTDTETNHTRGDRYTCSLSLNNVTYQQQVWDNSVEVDKGASPHNSDDEYIWEGRNVREDKYQVTVYKVWRDGTGPYNPKYPASRPDICFRLYRISYDEIDKLAERLTNAAVVPAEDYGKFIKNNYTKYTNDIIAASESVNEDKYWITSQNTQGSSDVDTVQANAWLWECTLADDVERYDENGSPYVYFLYEAMKANSDGYVASYVNVEHDQENLHAEAATTEDTYASTKDLDTDVLIVNDGINDWGHYSRIVVNTRQKEATISGQKTWNLGNEMFVGDRGIPYEEMPDINLKLWRDAASITKNGTEYVRDEDGNPTVTTASLNNSILVDKMTATGESQFKYTFPSAENTDPKYVYQTMETPEGSTEAVITYHLPRYNEYGYRYSYWMTEEPITSYESPNMKEGLPDTIGAEFPATNSGIGGDETGRDSGGGGTGTTGGTTGGTNDNTEANKAVTFNPQAGEFDITNRYIITEPNVKFNLKKSWEWPEWIADSAKNITTTFELHAVIVDKDDNEITNDGKPIAFSDQVLAKKTVTVKDGKVNVDGTETDTVTFDKCTEGTFARQQLPYYAPNGKPYKYYIKEVTPDGYEVKSVTVNGTKVYPQGTVTAFFSNIGNSIVSLFTGKEAKTYADTGLITPVLDTTTNEVDEIEVTYTNKYTGGGLHSLSVQKEWNEWMNMSPFSKEATGMTSLFSMRPTSVQVKLYRQWKTGSSTYMWEQVTKQDAADKDGNRLGWTQMDDKGFLTLQKPTTGAEGDTWTLEKPLDGLNRVAPNGQPYEYFVVEKDATDKDSAYQGSTSKKTKYPDVTEEGEQPVEVRDTAMKYRAGYSESVMLSEDGTTPSIPVTAKNDLKYKEVWYTKQWMDQEQGATDTKNMTQAQAQLLKDLGAMPKNLYFIVQYRLGDTGTWYYLPTDWSKFNDTNKTSSLTDATSIANFVHKEYLNYEYIDADMTLKGNWKYLPAYYQADGDANKQDINYRVVEVMQFDGSDDLTVVAPNGTNGSTTTTNESTDDISTTVNKEDGTQEETNDTKIAKETWNYTNTVSVTPFYLQKVWEGDNANRDDTRPKTITLKIKKDGTEIKSVTLSRDDLVEMEEGNTRRGNVYRSDKFYMPASMAGNGFTVEELDVPGYTPVETDSKKIVLKNEGTDDKPVYSFTATNKLTSTDRKTINLTVKKRWIGDENWKDITRPTVKFTLQYRYRLNNDLSGSEWSEWAKATAAATGLTNDEDATKVLSTTTTQEASVTWTNLYQYYTEDGTAIPRWMRYRVVEKMYASDGSEVSTTYFTPDNGESDAVDTTKLAPITVKNTLQTVKVSAKKVWKYQNGNATGEFTTQQLNDLLAKGVLPSYIRFELFYHKEGGTDWTKADSDKFEPLDVSTQELINGGGTVTCDKKLPKYDKDGKLMQYKLAETGVCYGEKADPPATMVFTPVENNKVASFTVDESVTGYTTTTTNTLPVGSLKVTKNWQDGENRDGLRDEITIELLRDNAEYAEVKLNVDNGWMHTWDTLPVYQNGKATEKSVYTVQEKNVPDKYTCTIDPATGQNLDETTATTAKAITVTNTHDPYTLNITATKAWADDNNFTHLRPDSITFQLKYSVDNGTTWNTVPYKADGFSKTDATDVAFSSVTNATGVTLNTTNYTVAITPQSGNWPSVTWNGLPANVRQNNTSTKVQYKVEEVNPSKAYTPTSTVVSHDGNGTSLQDKTITVTNTLKTTSVEVTKNWNDQNNKYETRPTSIEVKLQSKLATEVGWQDMNGDAYKATLTGDKWSHKFEKLPVANKDGTAFEYRVVETLNDFGYTKENEGIAVATAQDGKTGLAATLTNTLETVDISGKKVWDDGGNRDGTRPEKITVVITGTATDYEKTYSEEVTVDKTKNEQTWKLEGLPKYKPGSTVDNLVEITYTVSEIDVEGYTSTVADKKITNTHKPETTTFTATKTWVDEENKYSSRPESIKFKLQYRLDNTAEWSDVRYDENGFSEADAADVAFSGVTNAEGTALTVDATTGEVTINKPTGDGDWDSVKWNGLPKYAQVDGTKHTVQYQAVEVSVLPNYTSTSETSADGTTITNTLKTTEISGQKTWMNDYDNANHTRPDSITIHLLYADGTEVPSKEQEVKPDADGNWTWTFTDLPKFDKGGNEIAYTIKEDPVDNYASTVTGCDVTNTYLPKLTITKVDADTKATLSGAAFVLYKKDENGKNLYYKETVTDDVTTIDWVELSDTITEETLKKSSVEDGTLTFTNIPDGTYHLKEVNPPNGYYKLDSGITITVTNGVIKGTNGTSLTVSNDKGFWLPETGGAGTLPYTLGGLLLMAGAILCGVAFKRRRNQP